MEGLIFFLILSIPIILFNVVAAVYILKGKFYYEDEAILREHPHSMRARQIEEQRRSGVYNVYIPKKEREDYYRRYCSNNSVSSKEKGGE